MPTFKRILLSTFFLLSLIAFGQPRGRLPNKTLIDTVFATGDIIKIPEIVYNLSHKMNDHAYDSLVPVVVFLKNTLTSKSKSAVTLIAEAKTRQIENLQLSEQKVFGTTW
jgi:hypothetical protein